MYDGDFSLVAVVQPIEQTVETSFAGSGSLNHLLTLGAGRHFLYVSNGVLVKMNALLKATVARGAHSLPLM